MERCIMRKLFVYITAFLALVSLAHARTETFNWTWPTLRADGTPMPLASYGGIIVYDTTVPAPGAPGTAVPCPTTIPPTTPTGTCTTPNLSAGNHNFVAVTTDSASPPNSSPVSNAQA